jgi:hypothetical protein
MLLWAPDLEVLSREVKMKFLFIPSKRPFFFGMIEQIERVLRFITHFLDNLPKGALSGQRESNPHFVCLLM